MRASEEPVCIDIFWQNPYFTSLHLRSPVHVAPPQEGRLAGQVFYVYVFSMCTNKAAITKRDCGQIFKETRARS
jgi:hypothetical protein